MVFVLNIQHAVTVLIFIPPQHGKELFTESRPLLDAPLFLIFRMRIIVKNHSQHCVNVIYGFDGQIIRFVQIWLFVEQQQCPSPVYFPRQVFVNLIP